LPDGGHCRGAARQRTTRELGACAPVGQLSHGLV